MLSDDQKNYFKTFGFLVLRRVFTSKEIDEIRRECDRMLLENRQGKPFPDTRRQAMEPFFEHSPVLRQVMEDDRIYELGIDLLGPNFILNGTEGNLHVGDTQWHGGGPEAEVVPHIKIAFYLEPTTRDTGALRIIPGSNHPEFRQHLQPLTAQYKNPTAKPFGLSGAEVPATSSNRSPAISPCSRSTPGMRPLEGHRGAPSTPSTSWPTRQPTSRSPTCKTFTKSGPTGCRTPLVGDEINWELITEYSPYETFREIFYGENVQHQSYFDLITHFDFKTLLPALLKVEDRVSMAHGLESRVPLLDRPYVEFAATIPSSIKFENGNMKNIFKKSIKKYLPPEILNRKDKMGFPTPFSTWSKGVLKDYIMDTLLSQRAIERDVINNRNVISKIESEGEFSRSLWGFLSLELWQQEFHDASHDKKFEQQ